MQRFAVQAVLAVGVVIASSVFDFGSRAEAAYLTTTASSSSSARVCHNDTPAPVDPLELSRIQPFALDLQGGGGMTSPGSGGGAGSAHAVGLVSRVEPTTDGLVAYFREPAATLHFSTFIDSILDPPRPA